MWCLRRSVAFANFGASTVKSTVAVSPTPIFGRLLSPINRSRLPFSRLFSSQQGGNAESAVPSNRNVRTNGAVVNTYEANVSPVPARLPTDQPQPGDQRMRVKAYFISRTIDVHRLTQSEFLQHERVLPRDYRDSVLFRFQSGTPDPQGVVGIKHDKLDATRYLVVFGYGAVCFINFEEWREQQSLQVLKKYCRDIVDSPKWEDYAIVVRPDMRQWCSIFHDNLVVKSLDINNILLIAGILGQTVALEHYDKLVDLMLSRFRELNSDVEADGKFKLPREQLFQLVAANNGILSDVITKLGILDRSEIPWKYEQYSDLWEGLRVEFELDERFKSVDFKLNLIAHNTKFFLDMISNFKSDKLEWLLIILFMAEIGLGLYDIFQR